uniref:glucuronate isomerase n=1 Tax=Carnobacterium sp. TaxID=48221 RepID=UPI00344B1E9C
MIFIHEDFMLQNEKAKELYHSYAKEMPIYDYHCHLNPKEIADNHQFLDVTELWLAGDHYKWRAMRANGISEEKITGNASSKEKFEAWAQTVEACIGNPLYHWTHLEMKRYFDIDEQLNGDNWEELYNRANKIIKEKNLTAQTLIEQSNVVFIGTTDNPTDSLEYHDQINEDQSFNVNVTPSFRPDEAFALGEQKFIDFLKKLTSYTATKVTTYKEMMAALEQRIDYFDKRGCVASDHGISTLSYSDSTDDEIESIFLKTVSGEAVSNEEIAKYQTRLLVDLAECYYDRDWVMQIHFGAIRNNNDKMFNLLGPDVGFDSIKDQTNVGYSLNNLLDAMAKKDKLPKMVIYNLNPTYNHVVASAVANFQNNEDGIKGRIQFGAGWWFNDTEKGMLRQMETLADHGLLMHFVGMITDSRSFVSYPRHEYFRRILCNYIGENVENGKIPNDDKLLKKLIENICYLNAKNYFKNKK